MTVKRGGIVGGGGITINAIHFSIFGCISCVLYSYTSSLLNIQQLNIKLSSEVKEFVL